MYHSLLTISQALLLILVCCFFFQLFISPGVFFPGITDRSVTACLFSSPAFEHSQCLCPLPACCISPVPHKFPNGPDNQPQEDPGIKLLRNSWLGNIPLSSCFWPHSELSCPCCCGHCGGFRWGEEPRQGLFVPLCFSPCSCWSSALPLARLGAERG